MISWHDLGHALGTVGSAVETASDPVGAAARVVTGSAPGPVGSVFGALQSVAMPNLTAAQSLVQEAVKAGIYATKESDARGRMKPYQGTPSRMPRSA